MPKLSQRRAVFWLACVCLVAVFIAIRTMAFQQMSHSVYGRNVLLDSEYYYTQALTFARGQYQQKTAFFFGPGWPATLGLYYRILNLNSIAAGQFLNIVLTLLTLLLLGWIGHRLRGPRLALLLMAIWTFYGPAVFFEQTLLMETSASFALTLLIAIWTLLAITPSPHASAPSVTPTTNTGPETSTWIERRPALCIVIGFAMGFAALYRSNCLIVVPALAGFAAWIAASRGATRTQRVRIAFIAVLLFFVGLMAAITPTAMHNWRAERVFIPISSNYGINLWIGLGPSATGRYVRAPSATDNRDPRGGTFPRAETGLDLNSKQLSQFWAEKAVHDLTFSRLTNLCIRKLRLYFQPAESRQIYVLEYMHQDLPFLRWPLPGNFLIVVPLFLGIACLIRSRRAGEWALACGAPLLIASLLPFFITDRYRFAIMPWVLVVSAVGVIDLATVLFNRNWRLAAGLGVLLICGFIGLLSPIPGNADVYDYHQSKSVLLLKEKNYADALGHIREVNAREPNVWSLSTEATILEEGFTDYAKALELYEKALSGSDASAMLWFNAGQVQLRLGRKKDALRSYENAVRLDPDISAGAWHNMAALRQQAGDNAGAAKAAQEALRLNPSDDNARKLLMKLQTKPQPDQRTK